MDAMTTLRVAYAFFGTKWVNLRDLQERYKFLRRMSR